LFAELFPSPAPVGPVENPNVAGQARASHQLRNATPRISERTSRAARCVDRRQTHREDVGIRSTRWTAPLLEPAGTLPPSLLSQPSDASVSEVRAVFPGVAQRDPAHGCPHVGGPQPALAEEPVAPSASFPRHFRQPSACRVPPSSRERSTSKVFDPGGSSSDPANTGHDSVRRVELPVACPPIGSSIASNGSRGLKRAAP
jgi:hypothetical protein